VVEEDRPRMSVSDSDSPYQDVTSKTFQMLENELPNAEQSGKYQLIVMSYVIIIICYKDNIYVMSYVIIIICYKDNICLWVNIVYYFIHHIVSVFVSIPRK
jgi:hypothetical protein